MRKHIINQWLTVVICLGFGLFVLPGMAGIIYEGDGSDEPGFVPPPPTPPPPPAPPANMSSAETTIPFPCPPGAFQARSEKKNPPSPPVMFTKLTSQYGEVDWNARPNDLNNLLKSMKGLIDVNFACECKSFSEVDPDPERNPILYRSGHFHFVLSETERAKLRKYLLAGGMIILNSGMGSKPFYDSARKELQEMFPETQVMRLSPDHPIFHTYYDLDRVQYRKGVRQAGYGANEPWFEGITIDCRVLAVISRWGMEIGWDPVEDDSLMGYTMESAQQLGVNLMAYATAQRAWSKQAAHAMQFVDKETGTTAGKMFIAQVVYDGEWKTRHAGISVLLQQFNSKTEIPVKYERRELKLSDPKIFEAPLLYMTGHEDFRLSPAEINGLREYLNKGGLLFAEACCGRRAFDLALRQALNQALPGQTLKPIPAGNLIYGMPNKVTQLAITPALGASLGGKATVEPNLQGIEIGGHYAVIYSPYGMAGGWELSQNPYAHGYEDSGSIALGENILMYGITQ